MTSITAWLSPMEALDYAGALALLAAIRRKLPAAEIRVAIPSAYGRLLQGEMARPDYRLIADDLAPATLDGLVALRARFEADGYPCDVWTVPRDPEDGTLHGQIAALFDRCYLNTEWGWPDFWRHPGDVGAITAYLTAFWAALQDVEPIPIIGWTMVPNSMLTNSTDDELRAWAGGTHLVALETYLPGDPNLDPTLGRQKWRARAQQAGISPPDVCLVKQGDLAGYLAFLSDPDFGLHLWTLTESAPMVAALQDPAPAPEPCADLINALGYCGGDLVKALRDEALRRYGPRRAPILAIADTLERTAKDALG